MNKKLPVPLNETERLKRLHYYDILDSLPENAFDDLTELAANILDVPIVLVSLIDKDRQWFKSKYGLDADQTPRDISFCQFAIMGNEIFEVEDAAKDERFKDNPLVTGDPKIRFYAGSVLEDDDGINIGTLCAIDRKPRELNEEEKESLDAIGRTVMRMIKLRKEKKQVEVLSKAKDDFLANMSHEIRTPMNAIIGFNELLSNSELNNEQRKNVDIIGNASRNLMNILNNVLDFSKIESGAIELNLTTINLEETLKQITNLHRISAKSKNLKLKFSYDFDIPEYIQGDTTRLSQIFGNLLSNAIKFTEKGSVSFDAEALSISEEVVLVKFEIKDTGIGIANDKLDKIFERFNQAEASTTKLFGGTGLGLSISKELTNVLDGTIKVESKLNEGTCFTVTLPFKIADKKEVLNYKNSIQNSGKKEAVLEGLNILIAEDNEHNQILASTLLKKNGASYRIVENGQEAIESLKENDFDLLLLDLQMPVMDGIEATAIIRNELKSDIPIIACSAFSTGKEKMKCLDLKMNDYLAKPYMESDLVNSILNQVNANKGAIERTVVADNYGPSEADAINILEGVKEKYGADYLKKVLEIAHDRFPNDLDKIDQALNDSDLETVQKVAHLLIGSLSSIEFYKGTDIARELEASAINKDFDKCSSLFEKLKPYVNEILSASKQFYNE